MKLELQKSTAKRLFPDAPDWFQEIMKESFGKDFFKKKDFHEIKTVEDACNDLGICESDVFNESDSVDEIAYKKMKIVIKAINQDWQADLNDSSQRKWWPYFVLSSGFGFSTSHYYYVSTTTNVGSRLCTDTREKALYIAEQFEAEYKELFLYPEE